MKKKSNTTRAILLVVFAVGLQAPVVADGIPSLMRNPLSTDHPEGFSVLPVKASVNYDPDEAMTNWGDGAAWSGKGFNSWLSGGIQWNDSHWNIVLNPIFWASQNGNIIFPSSYPVDPKAPLGDAHRGYWDHPLRMGTSPIDHLDGGQSVIAFHWGPGFISVGTENRTWGPSEYNSILLSSNGPGMPSLEMGLQPWKTLVGSFEAHLIYGILFPSGYQLDPNNSDGRRFGSGLFLAYSPAIMPGFTLGAGRTIDSYWSQLEVGDFLIPFVLKSNWGIDKYDQRMSLMYRYDIPNTGLELYGEWARNDFTPGLYWILVNLEHSQGWVLGMKKTLELAEWGKLEIYGELGALALGEENIINTNGYAPDGGDFYTHSIIREGYTIEGQDLGAAIGNGNDQMVKATWTLSPWNVSYRFIRWVKDYSTLVATLTPGNEQFIDVAYDHQIDVNYSLNQWTLGLTVGYQKEFHRMFSNDYDFWRVGTRAQLSF